MAQLIVRKLEDTLVKKLKMRAARHGRSAEAEHREILRRALAAEAPGPSFKEALCSMPPVGLDRDFERERDHGRELEL